MKEWVIAAVALVIAGIPAAYAASPSQDKPKAAQTAMRSSRYLSEGSLSLRDVAKVTASPAERELEACGLNRELRKRGTGVAASCRPPRKTKSSPVFPVVGQLLQRHARHLTSKGHSGGRSTVAVRGAAARGGWAEERPTY